MKINSSLKSAKGKETETPLPIFFVNLVSKYNKIFDKFLKIHNFNISNTFIHINNY